MKLRTRTASFCNVCYREVSARVEVGAKGVFLIKQCPQHGEQTAMAERDPVFYTWVTGLNAPKIYGGYFVDVTRRCQLRCEPCYYRLENKDPEGMFTVDSIVNDCLVNVHHQPFIVTGGEPTLHPEIHTIIRDLSQIGPFELLTNGVKLADIHFFDSVMPLITKNNEAKLNLSIHAKETDKWKAVLERCRLDQIKIESILIVIDSKEAFLEALKLCDQWRDVVLGFRIKAASNLWHETRATERIFCSDMITWLQEAGRNVQFVLDRYNKPVFVNIIVDGLFLMLVSWNDVQNVDLRMIDCAPYYRARNGEVCNPVTANLVNEGMDKGYLAGQPYVPPPK